MERPWRVSWASGAVSAVGFAAVAAVWLPGTAHACSCDVETTADERLAQADAVFVGEALEVRTAPAGDPAEFERRYVFDVTEVYKGDVFARQSVVSSTEDSACGLPWDQEGAIALVFGYRDGGFDSIVEGELGASDCTTDPWTPGAVPASFGEPSAPIDGASPVGIVAVVPGEGGEAHLSWEWAAVGLLFLAGVAVGIWAPSGGPVSAGPRARREPPRV